MIGTLAHEFWRRKSVQNLFLRALGFTFIVAGSIFIAIPVAWMISTSLKTLGETFLFPPRWIPHEIRWDNYPRALTFIDYGHYLNNTLIITISAMIGQILSASLVAFGFARLRAPGRDFLFVVLLATLMLPYHVTLVPTYLLFRALGWLNTYLPLIVPSWLGGGAFFIFLLRQFFATLPLELDDAARIDGASLFDIYWRIMLPLSKPALATVAIFSFFAHWNDFLGPLIYLSRERMYTLSLGLAFYVTTHGQVEWNLLMAATLVTLLPPLILFFTFQRAFVQGIALTGLKG